MVELIRSGGRQGRARDEQQGAAQRLGRGPVSDALGAREDAAARLADELQLEPALAIAVIERTVSGDVVRPFGEAAELERAGEAMRGHDLGHADPRRSLSPFDHERWFTQRRLAHRRPSGAGGLGRASARLASSSWARLPVPRCLTVSEVMPAPSRKRATRSLGLAPLPSQ